MFNPNQTFGNPGNGGVNPTLQQMPAVAPVDTIAVTPTPEVTPAFPSVTPTDATPQVPVTQAAPEVTVVAPQAPVEPTGGPGGEPNLNDASTFYLLGEAMKANGFIPADFALDEKAADAASFIEATGKEIQKAYQAAQEQGKLEAIQKYEQIANEIEFRLKGGSLDAIEHLTPFKEALSVDIASPELTPEDQLQIKQVIINQALYVAGTKDPEVRELAIKGFIEKGSLDQVFEQSKNTIAQYVQKYEQDDIARQNQAIENQRLAAEKVQNDYVNSIKSTIAKGNLGGIPLPSIEAAEINTKIFGPKSETIEVKNDKGQTIAQPVTPWEKFMHNFFNNPEVQLQAFYFHLKGGAGINNLKQVASTELANKIVDQLNNRNNAQAQSSFIQPQPTQQSGKQPEFKYLKTLR